ncbi:MAG TPA: phage portal protein [Pilimelia sp.]|nr:phage portal protein [Pilimelia sp.]
MGYLASLMDRVRRSWLPDPQIPTPGAAPLAGSVRVSNETAMRHSAVWACLRLRADLISTMPVDVYRKVGDVRVSVPTPPVLINPGGERIGIQEWLYSTQVDLDRAGNCFGLITARDGAGRPARIELVELGSVGLVSEAGEITYRIDGKRYAPRDVWHERQFTISGLAVGLSPVAYAAWSIGSYLSAQQFALDWFGNSAIPAAELTNKAKTLTAPEAAAVKERYRATIRAGDVFVHGSDWELKPIQAVASQTQYVELMQYGVPDISRFFGCPADLIDGAVSGQSVTYANITQRNLQLLIMNLGPAVARRETALSSLVAQPRYVKLNRSALLAMDPATRAQMLRVQLESKQITPTEARAVEDRAPFTPEQIAEIIALYGAPRTQPTGATS